MSTNAYRAALMQTASLAIAALQCELIGTTDLSTKGHRRVLQLLLVGLGEYRHAEEKGVAPRQFAPGEWALRIGEVAGDVAGESAPDVRLASTLFQVVLSGSMCRAVLDNQEG